MSETVGFLEYVIEMIENCTKGATVVEIAARGRSPNGKGRPARAGRSRRACRRSRTHHRDYRRWARACRRNSRKMRRVCLRAGRRSRPSRRAHPAGRAGCAWPARPPSKAQFRRDRAPRYPAPHLIELSGNCPPSAPRRSPAANPPLPGLDARESILDDGRNHRRDAEPAAAWCMMAGSGLPGRPTLCHHHAVDTYYRNVPRVPQPRARLGVAAGREQRARNPCRIERIKQGRVPG